MSRDEKGASSEQATRLGSLGQEGVRAEGGATPRHCSFAHAEHCHVAQCGAAGADCANEAVVLGLREDGAAARHEAPSQPLLSCSDATHAQLCNHAARPQQGGRS